jgi:hypothetical protein
MLIPYTLYQWKPPELPLSERISLGEQIAKVGREAFVDSLKLRLSTHSSSTNNSFTFADIIYDAQRRQAKPPRSLKQGVVGLTIFGGGFAGIVAFGFAIPFLAVTTVSIGSLLWIHRKVDRWVQGLIDEYTHSIANENRENAPHYQQTKQLRTG